MLIDILTSLQFILLYIIVRKLPSWFTHRRFLYICVFCALHDCHNDLSRGYTCIIWKLSIVWQSHKLYDFANVARKIWLKTYARHIMWMSYRASTKNLFSFISTLACFIDEIKNFATFSNMVNGYRLLWALDQYFVCVSSTLFFSPTKNDHIRQAFNSKGMEERGWGEVSHTYLCEHMKQVLSIWIYAMWPMKKTSLVLMALSIAYNMATEYLYIVEFPTYWKMAHYTVQCWSAAPL